MPGAAQSASLWLNADVLTLDPDRPNADAVAVLGDRLLCVGSQEECRSALRAVAPDDVVENDLGGRCLMPGFIDTHLHPIALVYFDLNADLRGTTSIADVQTVLRRAAGRLSSGEWLVGLQLEEQELAERRLPDRHELDLAYPEGPLVVLKHDGHSCTGNSAALAAAGIDAGTADPAGGHFERDADGRPNGPCREAAAQILMSAVPAPGLERLSATARSTFGRLAACGITSAGVVLQTDEEGPGGASGRLESLAMQLLLEHAPFSTYAMLIGRSVDAALAARQSPLHDPVAGRIVGGFKIFSDGTFGSCTACMSEPFADRTDQRGYLTLPEDEILARMRAAHAAGLQICVHAIGDAAIDRCLTLFEQVLREQPRADHRHRFEHASLVTPALVQRIARLGVCVSTQPLFIHSEKEWLPRRLGSRTRYAYPMRSLIEAGVVVGGASDAPVESIDVLHAIQCCITREGFETHEALTPAQAVDLFTRAAAYLQFEESSKGTLAPGKRADMVLLSGNPLRTAPERLRDLRVLRTVTGGRVVYSAE